MLTDSCKQRCISNQIWTKIHAACTVVDATHTAAPEQGHNAAWMACCSLTPSGRSVQQVLLHCQPGCCLVTQKLLLISEQQLHHSKACFQVAGVGPVSDIHFAPAHSVKKLHAACAASLDRTATPASKLNASWDRTVSSITISSVCCLRAGSLA